MFEQISGIAEAIAAVGVIISLAYVGKQLKQTNTISRAAARQALSMELNEWAMAIASSPALTETFGKVHFHGLLREDADDLERIQTGYSFIGLFGQLHLAYEQTKEGVLSEDELDDWFGPNTTVMQLPYVASVWPVLKFGYPQDFQQWFELRYIADSSHGEIPENNADYPEHG